MFLVIDFEIWSKIAVMFLVLSMPVPSTPYLIIHFSSLDLVPSAFIYFTASTCTCFVLYWVGRIVPLARLVSLQEKWIPNKIKSNKMFAATNWSVEQAKNLSLRENLMARLIGIPIHVVAPVTGAVGGIWQNMLIANWICAVIDIMFYCFVFGSGRYLLEAYFPEKVGVWSGQFEALLFPLWVSVIAVYLVFALRKLFVAIR